MMSSDLYSIYAYKTRLLCALNKKSGGLDIVLKDNKDKTWLAT